VRWLLLLVSACSFSAKVQDVADDTVDAAIDSPPDAFDERCFGHAAYYFCLAALPTGSTDVGNGSINTTDCTRGTVVSIGTTPACVIAADRITLTSGDVAGVFGDKPLVLVAVTQIQMSGALDASSVRGNLGPNANPTACTPKSGAPSTMGGGGGAGGSFGSEGGGGGNGGGGSGAAPSPAVAPVDVLRGGCPGGAGAIGVAGTATDGGPGGGAVYLVSRGKMTLGGTINANGGGGEGAPNNKIGGAGGGTGGMIVIDAATLSVTAGARIVANGGGGAAGSGNANPGADGGEGASTTPSTPAIGGTSSTGGATPGGDGAAGTTAPTAGMPNGGGGGGGGGGGAGVIRVHGDALPAAQVSPVPVAF
jgi:hypothetical protein